MSPYERINTYRRPPRSPFGRSRWGRRFSAALPWVFVLGVAAGTMLPMQAVGALADRRASRQPGGARRRDDLATRRKSRRAAPRRCHQDHRRRHLRGAGASVARSRPDHAGSPARHRRAGTEGGLSAGIADGRGGDRAPCATCSARARSRSSTSGRTNISGRVVADVATRRTGQCVGRDARGRSRAQLQRRPSRRLVRERRSPITKRKSRACRAALRIQTPSEPLSA